VTTCPCQIHYEDPELGFCIVGYVERNSRQSRAHDHGPTRTIYGQAAGETVMTDWVMVSPPPSKGLPGKARARLHADTGPLRCTTRAMSTPRGVMARHDCCAQKDAISNIFAPPSSNRSSQPHFA
jgi:hypothetical protein